MAKKKTKRATTKKAVPEKGGILVFGSAKIEREGRDRRKKGRR